ncbi:uncharacterized protein LOC122379263 isoform X2 [Amphibalanus amphitrite]|uniref:uncharacterized protein LOC122379263 isoform X2 n=1 Tax=Amphibalanus amphitrite TaxID=1232801 RepID=UPI001C91CF6B|nr:uncharacterized protein LOC122379263 isoform X2 [Amphibalanus amphitrite]
MGPSTAVRSRRPRRTHLSNLFPLFTSRCTEGPAGFYSFAPFTSCQREMPKARAPSRGRAAAAASTPSNVGGSGRRSRGVPAAAAQSQPQVCVDPTQLRNIIQDVVQEALDASAASRPAAAPAPSYSHSVPAPTGSAPYDPLESPESSPLGNAQVVCDGTETVSAALRQKIVEDRFVDLGLLLDHADGARAETNQAFQLVDGQLRPASRAPRVITSFGTWCIAFLRYAGVYVQSRPAAAAGLMAHMRQVGQLTGAGLGLAWREYDEAFRKAREVAPQCHEWGTTASSSPLWLQAVARGIGTAARVGNPPVRPVETPMRFRPCFAYNTARGCPARSCRYQHACRTCRGDHPATRCASQLAQTRARIPRPNAGPTAAGASR